MVVMVLGLLGWYKGYKNALDWRIGQRTVKRKKMRKRPQLAGVVERVYTESPKKPN